MVTVVYSSRSGSSEAYAKHIATSLGSKCFSIKEVSKDLDDQILYVGWISGARVVGLNKVGDMKLKAVVVVGIEPESRFEKVKVTNYNKIRVPIFYLRGWIDRSKLNVFQKILFAVIAAKIKMGGLNQYNQPIFDAMMEGGSFYDESSAEDVIRFIGTGQQKS